MLRVVIVEDEKHSRNILKNLLQEFCEDVEVVGMAATVNDAITEINNNKPELVFLDIELQTGTGFDVLKESAHLSFEVVFTTAFEQYAIKAIKFSSIDYLLKPIDIDELQNAVEEVRKKKDKDLYHQKLELLLSNFTQKKLEHCNICLATADGIEFIKIIEILYCEANGSYTNFYLTNNKKMVVSKHLKEYENMLPPEQFMRVHNSYLINLGEVKKYVKSDGGYIVMKNDELVNISNKKKDEFLMKMATFS